MNIVKKVFAILLIFISESCDTLADEWPCGVMCHKIPTLGCALNILQNLKLKTKTRNVQNFKLKIYSQSQCSFYTDTSNTTSNTYMIFQVIVR